MRTKILLFVAFCMGSAFFFACSDDFIITASRSEKIKTTDKLEGISGFTIQTGLRDSLFHGDLGYVSAYNEEAKQSGGDLWAPEIFNTPELLRDTVANPDYLKHSRNRIREFFMSWNSVEGAVSYEVRVAEEPITEDNWYVAERVKLVSLNEGGDKITAKATITPTPKIYTANCVNCGECKKVCPTDAITYVNSKAVIDYDKCIECGECFRACDYNAIGGVFAGSEYYFAIRSIDEDSAYSEKITTLADAYKMRYVTLTSISDTLIRQDFDNNDVMKWNTGCGGNCTDGSVVDSSDESRGDCKQCYILTYNACPVDAVYQLDSAQAATQGTDPDAMQIDTTLCINCGECADTCYTYGKWGAVVTEVIKVN